MDPVHDEIVVATGEGHVARRRAVRVRPSDAKSAKVKNDAAIAKLATTCTGCAIGNAGAVRRTSAPGARRFGGRAPTSSRRW